MSGAFAALRGFRRRWADPESGPEHALEAVRAQERSLHSVTPDSASRSNGSFCLVEPEGASADSPAATSLLPASDSVGEKVCPRLQLGQSVLRRPPLHGREWAPQRVDGRSPLAIEPCFRPALQYRPLRGPSFGSRFSPLARVEQPLQPPVYRGTAFYDKGPRFRIDLHTAQAHVGQALGSSPLASMSAPRAPLSSRPQIIQGASLPPNNNVGRLGVRPRVASLSLGPKVVTSASTHSATWKKVLGMWSELVSRHASCSPHFAGALSSEHKEVLLSQMLSRMADTTLLRYLRSVMLFFDMMDTMRLQLSDLHQAHVMDVLLCLQEASGGPLVAQINQVKALRWYVRASGIPFPDLYGGLFLSVMQPPDGERKEAAPLPLAVVVALERLVLNPDKPTTDRLIAAAFLTCVWAGLPPLF